MNVSLLVEIMFPFDLWQCVVLGSCVLIALAILSFGFSLAWGLRNDLHSWQTTILYYGWVLLGIGALLSPPMLLQILFLTGLWLVGLRDPWNSKRWLQWGCPLSLLAWGIGGYWSYQVNEQAYGSLKEQFPMVSLAGRLPRAPLSDPGDGISLETLEFVNDLENACSAWDEPEVAEFGSQRALRVIHGRKRWEILGVACMIDLVISRMILDEGRPEKIPDVLQPPRVDSQVLQDLKPDLQFKKRSEKEWKKLRETHQKAVVALVRPYRFGYVRDIDHVAGFQAHALVDMPKSPEGWNIARLDLVSLLVHEGPVIYQSDQLPRMTEAADIPTQPLDPWEALAFQQIAQGENLVVAKFAGGLQMMGAIRNARHCTQCHGGKPGDLLGAFAYKLTEAK